MLILKRYLNSILRKVIGLLPAQLRLQVQSHLDVRQKNAEPENIYLPGVVPLERRRVALDIGANTGVTTWLLSQKFELVHGFEPNPQMADALLAAAPGNMEVHQLAVSSTEGNGELLIPISQGVSLNGWASLGNDVLNSFEHVQRVNVPTRTIDSFEFDIVDYIKIDVEGHEMFVLQGGQETIKRCQPWLVVEAMGDRQNEVRGFLMPLGYEEQTLQELTGKQGSPHNLIFVPRT